VFFPGSVGRLFDARFTPEGPSEELFFFEPFTITAFPIMSYSSLLRAARRVRRDYALRPYGVALRLTTGALLGVKVFFESFRYGRPLRDDRTGSNR